MWHATFVTIHQVVVMFRAEVSPLFLEAPGGSPAAGSKARPHAVSAFCAVLVAIANAENVPDLRARTLSSTAVTRTVNFTPVMSRARPKAGPLTLNYWPIRRTVSVFVVELPLLSVTVKSKM
jgi:hypothetical protein